MKQGISRAWEDLVQHPKGIYANIIEIPSSTATEKIPTFILQYSATTIIGCAGCPKEKQVKTHTERRKERERKRKKGAPAPTTA